MIKTNYHTHTLYCDGKNSPEEVILSAIEKKIDILGFSGHSMYPFAEDWHISPKQINDYVTEIKTLAVRPISIPPSINSPSSLIRSS